MSRFMEGEHLYFTEDIHGVIEINKGDEMRYLGNNQARILTGPSKGYLVTLTIDAPVKADREGEGL